MPCSLVSRTVTSNSCPTFTSLGPLRVSTGRGVGPAGPLCTAVRTASAVAAIEPAAAVGVAAALALDPPDTAAIAGRAALCPALRAAAPCAPGDDEAAESL